MAMGRPTKYKKEYCELLIAHMTEGLSFESFGATAMVTRDTLYGWAKAQADFSDAKKIGTLQSMMFWEKLGRSGAAGKLSGFNSGTWIFNMKNRFGWRDKSETVTRDETLKSPHDMTDTELDERLAHALKVVEDGAKRSGGDNTGSTKKKAKKKQGSKGKK